MSDSLEVKVKRESFEIKSKMKLVEDRDVLGGLFFVQGVNDWK